MREEGVGRVAVRGLAWTMVWLGGTILLYLAWLLWLTGIQTARVQTELLAEFDATATTAAGEQEPSAPAGVDPAVAPAVPMSAAAPGDAVAVLRFARPGSDVRPVLDGPVVVVAGTDAAALRTGPGQYRGSAAPGQDGNFAVAGHRTTYGQPFHHLDQLRPDDLVEVTKRDGSVHTYEIVAGSSGGGDPGQHIVDPTDTWVLDPDPVGLGAPTLTLTTCHPRFSATFRMVVFGRLVRSASA